jgi:hypothetical protein
MDLIDTVCSIDGSHTIFAYEADDGGDVVDVIEPASPRSVTFRQSMTNDEVCFTANMDGCPKHTGIVLTEAGMRHLIKWVATAIAIEHPELKLKVHST